MPLFDAFAQKGLDPDLLLRGVPYEREWLHDRNRSIDWKSFCLLLKNYENELTDEEMIEFSSNTFRQPAFRIGFLFARHVLTVREFYGAAFEPVTGSIPKAYPGGETSITELNDTCFRLDIVGRDG